MARFRWNSGKNSSNHFLKKQGRKIRAKVHENVEQQEQQNELSIEKEEENTLIRKKVGKQRIIKK